MTETIKCPKCEQALHVPEELHGKTVECPECQHQFEAQVSGGAVVAGPAPAPVSTWAVATTKPAPGRDDEPRPRRAPDADEDEDDDEDTDVRKPVWGARHLEPHRGSTIMTLGILSIFLVPLVLGTMAWIMGNADLKKMEEGTMDPRGKSQTMTGRTIGMVMAILNLVTLILIVGFLCILLPSIVMVRK